MDEILKQIAQLDAQLFEAESKKKKLCNEIKMMNVDREKLADQAVEEMVSNGCTMAEVAGLRWGLKHNPPKPIVTDESVVPDVYFKIKKEINKTLINKAVELGEQIPGVSMDNGSVSLTVRGMR